MVPSGYGRRVWTTMGYDMGDMMDGYGSMMGGGLLWGLLALFVLLVLAAAIVTLVVYAVRHGAHDSGAQGRSPLAGSSDAAADILRRRYAAGEIDDEEFTRRSELIGRR